LVTVEVGVERCTYERVKLNSLTFDKNWFEGLDPETVKSWSSVKKNRMLLNYVVEDIPNFLLLLINHAFCNFDGCTVTFLNKFVVDEWLEELEGHHLRKTTLVELKVRTNHDNGSTRVVHTLTEEVLTETTLLPFEHIRERAQRTLVGTGENFSTATVIKKGIHSFLEHALFVPDDDLWSVKLFETLKTVVSVNHTTVKIVKI